MVTKKDLNKQRKKRHKRIRAKISGTSAKPRLCVYRSLNHISVQLIDDVKQVTLVSATSQEKGFGVGSNKDAAKKVGALIAERAKAKGISEVVFDRAGYLYHGRVAELAAGARDGGLKF